MAEIPALTVNRVVEVEILTEGKSYYKTKVTDVKPGIVQIATPISRGVLVPIPVGTELKIFYHDVDAIYSFEATVLSRSTGKVAVFEIAAPSVVQRTQRRNFVRLDLGLQFAFTVIDEGWERVKSDNLAMTSDLSGGGLRFETDVELTEGTLLDTLLYLPNQEPVSAVGKVVRVLPSREVNTKFSVGLQFTIIEESDRDIIIKYIFEKQRELRQKGLI